MNQAELIILGLISLIPFLVLFFGILKTKLKLHWITLISVLTSLALSIIWKPSIETILISTLEGLILALVPIIWVIASAVFTYLISIKTGAMDKIKTFLLGISPDKNIQAVIVAFCFGGFLESVAGFGTAVAIPTGILVSIGFNPIKAAVISLVANSVPVAFGALGLPVIVLSKITELNLTLLTKYVVLQLLPFSLLIPLAIAVISNDGFRNIKNSIKDALKVGIVFTITQTLVGFFIGAELVALMGTIVSIAFLVIEKKIRKELPETDGIIKAIVNYLILLILVFFSKVLFKETLSSGIFVISLNIAGHIQKIEWLSTPGTLLFISSILGALIQGANSKNIYETLIETLDKIKWSAFAIVNILIIAKVMGSTGMITSLAFLISSISGKMYPLFSGFVGAIGTFITGSDTSSNILFGKLQKETAMTIKVDPSWISASNTSGATAGKMISPQSIAVASATIGLSGKEKQILKSTLPICIVYSLLLGIYVLIVSLLM